MSMDAETAAGQGTSALSEAALTTAELGPDPACPTDPWAVRRAALALAVCAVPVAVATQLFRGVALLAPDAFFLAHCAAELVCVLAAFAIFATQWKAAGTQGLEDARARMLGVCFLGVGALEALHLLSFPGMPLGAQGILGMLSVDQSLFYGVSARLWAAAALLMAAFVSKRSSGFWLGRPGLLLATTAAVLALLAAGVALPAGASLVSSRDGGPGPLGLGLGACVGALCVAAAILYAREYRRTGRGGSLRLATALAFGGLAGVCFLAGRSFDVLILLGHVYQAACSWLVLGALFTESVVRPFEELHLSRAELSARHVSLARLGTRIEGELDQTFLRLREGTQREQQARREMEAATAVVPDGLVFYDREGTILRMNGAAEAILGYPPGVKEWSLEARWRSLRPESSDGQAIPVEQSAIARSLGGEEILGQVVVLHPPKRKPARISLSAAPIRGTDGDLHGAVACLTDTSSLQALRAQGEDLLRVVSHDLRSLLQIILLQAERLQGLLGGDPSSRARGAADTIAATVRQVEVMIRDIVESGRLEMGLLRLAKEPIQLGRFAEQLLAHATLAGAGRLRLEIPGGLPPVAADPVRLERIFLNLVSNALEFSAPPTEIRISASRAFTDVVVSIADQGQGIAPEDLPRIFERFYRGRSTQRAGLGLGLHIARLLVEAHGGSIWADSSPGQGSTVTFTLPIAG